MGPHTTGPTAIMVTTTPLKATDLAFPSEAAEVLTEDLIALGIKAAAAGVGAVVAAAAAVDLTSVVAGPWVAST